MSFKNSYNLGKNEKKRIIKDRLHIMLKKTLNQIVEQLKVYSERNQLINNESWNRLIDNTFHRYLRKAHKDVQMQFDDKKYWNDYKSCISNFMMYIKQFCIIDENEEAYNIIFRVWGGYPKFDIIILAERIYFSYLIFESDNFLKIKKCGLILLSLRKRNESSEIDAKNLEEYSKNIRDEYDIFFEKGLLFYLTPYGVNHFTFKFNKDSLKGKIDDREKIEEEYIEKEEEQKFHQDLEIKKEESISPEPNIFSPIDHDWVGKIIQSEPKPMRQGKGTKRVEDIVIEGWIYEKYCHLARHNRYFIAQHSDLGTANDRLVPKGHKRRLLIKINDYKDWAQNVAHEISDDPNLGHFTRCWFNFERFLDPDNQGSYRAVPVADTGVDKYKIRDITSQEYSIVHDLPYSGVPLGLFVHDDDVSIKGYPITKIPFYFPVNDQNYEQLFYTPTFLVGRPGSGKTNAIKVMAASSLSCDDYCSGEKPAFIFFDYEGQFSSLANPSLSTVGGIEDNEVWNLLNIRPVNHINVEILSGSSSDSIKFSFGELLTGLDITQKINTLKFFLRNLSEITEIAFNEISRKIFSESDPATYSGFRKEFENELENPTIKASESLTRGQRQALIRTLLDDIKLFFDKKNGKSFNLLNLIKPGKVLVFDLKNLSKEKTILYVLLMLKKLKFENNVLKSPVIVVVDEAHEVFKNVSGSSTTARYYNLISKFIAEFGSRGRKYRLGLWLASQRPQDLHKDIQKVIVTYFILGLNPEHRRWLTAILGSSKNADIILNLPNRFAIFKNSSLYRGRSYILKLIKSPNVHRTFV